MDKTVAGLLGAMGALAAATPAHAAAQPFAAETAMQASSYSDLLRPIPNALETLRAVDAQGAAEPEGRVEQVQYEGRPHHHHHRYYRRRHHHHHHHHHHHGYDRY